MLNDEDVILIGLAVAALPNKKKTLKRKRRKWENFPYAEFCNCLLEYFLHLILYKHGKDL
jgi:hypothetical protein